MDTKTQVKLADIDEVKDFVIQIESIREDWINLITEMRSVIMYVSKMERLIEQSRYLENRIDEIEMVFKKKVDTEIVS